MSMTRLLLSVAVLIGLLAAPAVGSPVTASASEPADRAPLQDVRAPGSMPLYAQETVTLQPVATKSVKARRFDGRYVFDPSSAPLVGWFHKKQIGTSPFEAYLNELAVKFDLSALDQGKRKVTRAVLRFDELAYSWTNESGAKELKEGCVARLGLATTDWDVQPIDALVPNDPYAYEADGSGRIWTVTDQVQRQLAAPDDPSLRYGYVLKGAKDVDDLISPPLREPIDRESCVSELSNVRLEVTAERLADLTIDRLDVKDKDGSSSCVSGTVIVSASVRNDGNLGTSYEAVLYVNGKAVERLYTNLARNTTKVEQFSPAELVAGENAIRVILDPDREKAESNESNNSRSTKVTCAKAPDPKPVPKAVDLQVEKFDVLDAANKPGCVDGNANLIHVWITNAGDVEFLDGNFSIGLSIDGQPTKPLTMGGIGAPPSNKKDGFFENVSLTKGDHTFQVTVNPDGQAPEADTTNNTSAPQTVTCREQ
jgi:hypothetical protein